MSAGVLVIEDEIGLGNNIKKYLERYEYDVRLVRTGADGIAQCAVFQPDIALIDYQLPDMNGLEILRHLDHLIEHVGETRVGFGSDFDGAVVPEAMGDVAGLVPLRVAMRDHGYDEAQMERLCHGNWLRVLEATWH